MKQTAKDRVPVHGRYVESEMRALQRSASVEKAHDIESENWARARLRGQDRDLRPNTNTTKVAWDCYGVPSKTIG